LIFFIQELGLIFEIDGSSHDKKHGYDQERDAVLNGLGLKVVRILDKEILKNISGVWEFVNLEINKRIEESTQDL
jgi:very-short-patch-repair endonuclease